MTPKERIFNVIQGKREDRPPCICPGGMMNMITAELMEKCGVSLPEAHADGKKMAQLALSAYNEGCFENVGVPFCMTVEAEEMGAGVDMGSNVIEPHVVFYPMQKIEDFTRLKRIDITQGRSKVVLDAIGILKEKTKYEKKGIPIIGNLTGPISTATSLLEPSTFYKGLRKEPEHVEAFLNFVTEQLIAFGQAQIQAGVNIIAISDPSGTGEILGPKYFSQFAIPYINKMVDAFKEMHIPTIVHICGQMEPVFTQLGQIHSDILSFDAIVSMKKARKHLGNRVLMGNVSTYAVEFAEPEKITELTRKAMESGVDIVSPACGLGMKSPLINVQAMLKAARGESLCQQ